MSAPVPVAAGLPHLPAVVGHMLTPAYLPD